LSGRIGGGPAASKGPAAGALDLPDDEAVRRVRAGDRDAFRVLVERHQGRAFRLARRVLRDEEGARDAVQEAFLKAYASLDRFEGRSGFYTWLYRLVLNQCLDMLRRRRSERRVDRQDDDDALENAAADPPQVSGVVFEPAAETMRGELREKLAAAIATLPEAARQTLLLREVDGLSYAEIAEALDIPKGTVMSRLHYARQRLQHILAGAGVTPDLEDET
jgi:RNA polymerase sigma-70 factor (ECF subfamily)